MDTKVIQIDDVSKFYGRFAKPHHRLSRKRSDDAHVALSGVSFSVSRGETVAIIGRNGSGKSTLLQIVAGTLTPSSGVVNVNGRVAALLELGAGFDPAFTGRENARLSAGLFGFKKEDWIERFEDIERFADIGDYLDEPVKTYSSGMYARLGFAVAINVNPDILIVDEALAVGDEAFQRKCYAKLKELQKRGVTILFVSHSAATVTEICDRAILLDRGELMLEAAPKIAVSMYQRLLYAPHEQAADVRIAIKELFSSNGFKPVERITSNSNDDIANTALKRDDSKKDITESFDVNMRPETTVRYVDHGVLIEDIQIYAHEGKRVNMLVHGETYVYSYRVRFFKNVKSMSFGMLIKTVSGVEVGGGSYPPFGAGLLDAQAGETLIAKFRFRCLLNPGTYFTNAGVLSIDSETPQYLARVVDGMMFKVLPDPFSIATAIVDFDIHAEVDKQ